jgi:urate oxidase
MKLNENYEGRIFDICIKVWGQKHKAPSVRMTAFKYIVKIVKKHPELTDEITFLTQEHYLESLSPGVKNSIKRIMQELKQ